MLHERKKVKSINIIRVVGELPKLDQCKFPLIFCLTKELRTSLYINYRVSYITENVLSYFTSVSVNVLNCKN